MGPGAANIDEFAEGLGNIPSVKKGIFGNLGSHASGRAVERGVFSSLDEATSSLKSLTSSLKANGFPKGTIPDTTRPDSFLVPVGNNGFAVFRVKPNGTAQLRTTLNQK